MNEENKNASVFYWLLLITFLVSLIIFIGGLTRLTDSGLSITKWDLFSGVIPPLTLDSWKAEFELYKNIPEYKIINPTMTLEEFKVIYLWEYAHRFLGRLIGIVYILPLIYFNLKGLLPKKYLPSLYLIFVLILFQGFVGWFMVKSGLTERIDVSHYRLSLHLSIAFFILVFLVLIFLKYVNKSNFSYRKKIPFNLPIILLSFILIQISVGAFVSGLDAGQIYQTWPLMNETYFPNDLKISDFFRKDLFSIPSMVQFIHRNIAYFIFILFLIISIIVYKDKNLHYLKKYLILIFLTLSLQIFLGICTVLTGAQIQIASMHQVGSIVLVIFSVLLVFKNSKTN